MFQFPFPFPMPQFLLSILTYEPAAVGDPITILHWPIVQADGIATKVVPSGTFPVNAHIVEPAGPCGPVAPVSPLGPAGPCGPVAPVSPLDPAGPCGPIAPVSPLGPA